MKTVLLCLLFSLTAFGKAKEPVAVMQFRNLNDNQALKWLTTGIAETMVSDLRKNGMDVVERQRIDDALAEMALQGKASGDTLAAARIGKIIGAKTVVVGSFQQAGDDIRITARFVTVETGRVQGTAKTTGKLKNIFSLQDRIVAKLLGKKPKPRRRKKKLNARRKRTKAVKANPVEAYRLYSLSLRTSSKAERIGFLKKAIAVDPDFTYALDELDRLEAKLQRLQNRRIQVENRQLAMHITTARDTAQKAEVRAQAAFDALIGLVSTQRCTDVIALVEEFRPYEEEFTKASPLPIASLSRTFVFNCLYQLRRYDEALQYGEKLLESELRPTEARGVESTMKTIIEWKRRRSENIATWPEDKAKIDKRLVRAKERAQKYDSAKKNLPRAERSHAAQIVSGLFGHQRYQEAYDAAAAFLQKYDRASAAKERDQVFEIMRMSLWLRGRFDDARALIDIQQKDGASEKTIRDAKSNAAHWPR